MAAGKVVETSGTAAGTLARDRRPLAELVEAAMGEAALAALAAGITDQDEVLRLKMAARERVKADNRA
jgi:hypothetical protein